MADSDETGAGGGLKRRWATIIAADVVGYTRLMANDPQATVSQLEIVRSIVHTNTEQRGGYVADKAGDSMIAVFDTSAGALYAACAAQREIAVRAEGVSDTEKMVLRMGLHIGDILEKDDGTVYGDGVNLAARLEALAPSGGITASDEVKRACGAIETVTFVDQGEFEVKNVDHPLRVHLVLDTDTDGRADLPKVGIRRESAGNLPVRATSLVGRDDAIQHLSEELQQSRLVTVLGMGGLGKTSLSIATAHKIGMNFPDGAWFVDLAAVSDPAAVPLALAGVFSVTQQGGKSIEDCLVEALRTRRLLLIFDNCEHVTAAAAKLADTLLTGCPNISIIATSREILSISGERVMPLAPLDVDGQSSPALALFAERAKAVVPDFDLEPSEAVVRAICVALDGIPLAIELAAARVRSMTPQQIHDRLNKRFKLLTGGSRAVRERHQTLLQAVQWSYDLLTEIETTVLDRATVFAGSFSLDAAETVCSGGDVDEFEVIDTLDSLVSKSLITVMRTDEGLRYGMLETIRAFGAERLAKSDEAEDVRRKHAYFFADQADVNFKLWRSPKERQAYTWLDLEINNLRDAFRWALDANEVDPAARIASSVGDMGRFRLREEAANWAEEIVDAAREARHPRLTILTTWCASSAWAFTRFDDAKRFGEEALALLDDEAFEPFVWAHGDLAFVAIFSGDVPKAIELLAQGAAHPADAVDRFMMAFHLFILATAGGAEEARSIADGVIRQVDAAGVPMARAIAHGARGAALAETDPDEAILAFEHAIKIAGDAGARFMETLVAPRLAALHARSGEPGVALEGFERMLVAYGDATDLASVSAWRVNLVTLFVRTGQLQAAATLHGTLAGLIDQSSLAPEHEDAVRTAHKALGVVAFTDATKNGASMSLLEANEYALAQVRLGLESQHLGQNGDASYG